MTVDERRELLVVAGVVLSAWSQIMAAFAAGTGHMAAAGLLVTCGAASAGLAGFWIGRMAGR